MDYITFVLDALTAVMVVTYFLLLSASLLNLLHINGKISKAWTTYNESPLLYTSKEIATNVLSKGFLLMSAIAAPFMVYLGFTASTLWVLPVLTVFTTSICVFGALYLSTSSTCEVA